MRFAMSLVLLALAVAPAAARAAPPDGPPSAEARREHHRQLRERVHERLEALRTAELIRALSLSDAEAARLSAEFRKFDERREALREQVLEARWTVADAVRGDAAAAARLDSVLAAATEARKRLADLALEEYRALAALVPAEKRPDLARFLLQFPQRVQRLIHEAVGAHGHGHGPGDGPGPRHPRGPRDDPGPRGEGPRDGTGPGCLGRGLDDAP